MGIEVNIDGFGNLSLEFLVSDLNGTLSMYGTVSPTVKQLIAQVSSKLEIYIVTADTLQTGHAIAKDLGVKIFVLPRAKSQAVEKAEFVTQLGSEKVVVMGNGRNDYKMFQAARLAIGILGEEGISPRTMDRADLIVSSPIDALKLLLNPLALKAGLRN